MTTIKPPPDDLWSRLRHVASLVGTRLPNDHPHRRQIEGQVLRLEQLVLDVLAHGADIRTLPDDREDG